MKTVIFEAEVVITDKEWKKLVRDGMRMVYDNSPVATVFNKPIKFKRAYVQDEAPVKVRQYE